MVICNFVRVYLRVDAVASSVALVHEESLVLFLNDAVAFV